MAIFQPNPLMNRPVRLLTIKTDQIWTLCWNRPISLRYRTQKQFITSGKAKFELQLLLEIVEISNPQAKLSPNLITGLAR